MLGRALAVTSNAAAKSIALTLLPASFISLFAWATAGSSSGNTTDPIRASVWIWLGAHLIPFHLHIASDNSAGALTILPLGALIFPIWAIRKSFPKVKASLKKIEGARFFFALLYSIFATVLAIASRSTGIAADWYLVPIFTFAISYIATYDFRAAENRYLRFAFYTLMTVWGIGAVVVAISMASHWSVLNNLGLVIAPGIVGGILFFGIQALYLPNAAFVAIAYLFNIGFHLGAATSIGATHFNLHGIPAIPLMSALPTGKHPLLVFGSIFFLAFVAISLLPVIRENKNFKARQFFLLRTLALLTLLISIFAYLSSGELLTAQMRPVGVTWWRVSAFAFAAGTLVLILSTYLPALIKKLNIRVRNEK